MKNNIWTWLVVLAVLLVVPFTRLLMIMIITKPIFWIFLVGIWLIYRYRRPIHEFLSAYTPEFLTLPANRIKFLENKSEELLNWSWMWVQDIETEEGKTNLLYLKNKDETQVIRVKTRLNQAQEILDEAKLSTLSPQERAARLEDAYAKIAGNPTPNITFDDLMDTLNKELDEAGTSITPYRRESINWSLNQVELKNTPRTTGVIRDILGRNL